jgi:hypothetical protein
MTPRDEARELIEKHKRQDYGSGCLCWDGIECQEVRLLRALLVEGASPQEPATANPLARDSEHG